MRPHKMCYKMQNGFCGFNGNAATSTPTATATVETADAVKFNVVNFYGACAASCRTAGEPGGAGGQRKAPRAPHAACPMLQPPVAWPCKQHKMQAHFFYFFVASLWQSSCNLAFVAHTLFSPDEAINVAFNLLAHSHTHTHVHKHWTK